MHIIYIRIVGCHVHVTETLEEQSIQSSCVGVKFVRHILHDLNTVPTIPDETGTFPIFDCKVVRRIRIIIVVVVIIDDDMYNRRVHICAFRYSHCYLQLHVKLLLPLSSEIRTNGRTDLQIVRTTLLHYHVSYTDILIRCTRITNTLVQF